MAEAKKKICFVVGPMGEPESDIRVHADWILEEIIQPVVSQFVDFLVVRADQIAPPGMIDAQVIQYLLESELVIADLSRENPNAFYEIGIRHMAQRPIIHMQLADEKVPFDVSLYRTLKFSRTRPSDLKKARDELKRAVEAVLADDYKVDNPITRARGQIRLEEEATPSQKVLMEQIRAIQYRLDSMDRREEQENQKFGAEDAFQAAMQSVTTVSIGLASLSKLSSERIETIKENIVRIFPPEVVRTSVVSGNDIIITTIPGFMTTKEWREIRDKIFGGFKVISMHYRP